MNEVMQQQLADTLTGRLVALLTEHVLMIAGLILVAATISVLWTEFAKAEIVDGEGGRLEDRVTRWRVRKVAFWAGTIPAFILVAVMLPPLTPVDWPIWVWLPIRIAIAASLAPIAGLISPLWWLALVKAVWPIVVLLWQAAANAIASKAFGRKGQVKATADGGTGFKPEAAAGEDSPKTEMITRGDPPAGAPPAGTPPPGA